MTLCIICSIFCPSSYFLPYLVNTLVFSVLKHQHDILNNFAIHASMYLFVFVETCIASNRLCCCKLHSFLHIVSASLNCGSFDRHVGTDYYSRAPKTVLKGFRNVKFLKGCHCNFTFLSICI